MNESGWFLAGALPSTYPALCFKEIQVRSKIRVYFPLELCSKLWTFSAQRGVRKVVAQSVINWTVVGQLS